MNSGSLWAVIVIILVALVGWVAYTQGFFKGADTQQEDASINIDLGGESTE